MSRQRRREQGGRGVQHQGQSAGKASQRRKVEGMTWCLLPRSVRKLSSPVGRDPTGNTEEGVYKEFWASLSVIVVSWLG